MSGVERFKRHEKYESGGLVSIIKKAAYKFHNKVHNAN